MRKNEIRVIDDLELKDVSGGFIILFPILSILMGLGTMGVMIADNKTNGFTKGS